MCIMYMANCNVINTQKKDGSETAEIDKKKIKAYIFLKVFS